MIGCPNCGTPNRRGSKFCSNCGQRLDPDSSVVCPSCHTLNPLGSAYCSSCGLELESSTIAQGANAEELDNDAAGPGPTGLPPRELPQWLHPPTDVQAETLHPPVTASTPPSIGRLSERRSKYLDGLHDVLPSADTWLLSSQDRTTKVPSPPLNADLEGVEPKRRGGCLASVLVVLLGIMGFALLLAL
jgi:hypothetical protein